MSASADRSLRYFVRRDRFGVRDALALLLTADFSVFERGWEVCEWAGGGRARVIRRTGDHAVATSLCRRLNAEHEQWPAD